MSESATAIRKFLAQAMDTGYATRFADATCVCGCRVFSLEADEQVGEAWWFCQACSAAYQLQDPGGPEDSGAGYAAVDCVCTCGKDKFEIAVGVTLYGQSDTARTAYIGCRCVECGRVECYATWPRIDATYSDFFGTMREPRG